MIEAGHRDQESNLVPPYLMILAFHITFGSTCNNVLDNVPPFYLFRSSKVTQVERYTFQSESKSGWGRVFLLL